MRFIVYGAGAVGGLAGALMAEGGRDVVLIARGAHADAIASHGLTVESADGSRRIDVPVVTDPVAAGVEAGDAVLLAMKSQDTADALAALRRAAPATVAVACLQNGVDNERAALRLFPNVYAVCVMCPATHLEPGVVQQNSVPTPGLLDIGRYPAGVDEAAAAIAAGFRAGGFESVEQPDIMRWKYRKLLMNLANSVDALCGGNFGSDTVSRQAREEGEACLRAAGIDVASVEEDRVRRGDTLRMRPIAGRSRPGGSSWQSMQRGTGRIETDWMNGEISLLGRLHGVPTPANDLLTRLAWQAAERHDPPGTMTPEELEALL
ncbi:MAG: 2-dehydropantoate 2-reductase [Actinomycetota bacterium]|nr:2-dehydropantoate 2-reductase [Actinomycetota bacterium]